MSPPARLRLERVSVSFADFRALTELDLSFEPGEAVALVGPSGAGKTTLLRLLNGSQRPSVGGVEVGDTSLSKLSRAELRDVRASVGFVHQDLGLVPNLRVVQNVLAGRLGRQGFAESVRDMLWTPRSRLEEVYALLDRVGIGDKLFARTDRLSGGEQQRVALARALYQQPSVLLADEPVASVDPARARDTIALLASISRERNLTLVVSLHSLELAREFFPRLIGLRAGRVAFDRAPADVDPAQIDALYRLQEREPRDDAG